MTYWSYDERGQLVRELRDLNGNWGDYLTQWEYNSAGMLQSMTYPGDNDGNPGETVVYSYHS